MASPYGYRRAQNHAPGESQFLNLTKKTTSADKLRSARCIYGVVLPIVGVLLTWLVTYVTYQRKGRVARIHVIALFALSLVFLGLGIYLGTILVRASGSGALAERARILRIALTVTGSLTAAAMGLFVFIPIVFHIAQRWGVHITGIK